jgi:hypothetical protein
MQAVRATVPWLLLLVALAAWWPRPTLPEVAEPLPPPEIGRAVALAMVSLPAPPPMPAPEAEVAAPLAPATTRTVQPLQPSVPTPTSPTAVVPLRPTPEPAAAPEPAPPAPEVARQRHVPETSIVSVAEGRALLRLLEHGRGPQISIDWPGGGEARRLAERLAQCHGMRVALLDGEGRLWRAADPAGQPWQINLDRFSGFLRVGAGDGGEAARIRRRHGVAGQPVRLFPRAVDAHLLASLRQAMGGGYGTARRIGLRYRIDSGRVVLDAIRVDGRPLPGRIRLAGTGACHA